MKQGSFFKVMAGAALALTLLSGAAMASDTKAKDKQEVLYPNATRQEPKTDLTDAKISKALNEGLDAVNNGENDKAVQILQPIADSSKSKYAQALALQGLANMKYNAGDVKGAIVLLKQALDNGVMPNDTYFQLKYMLTQFYAADEEYAAALASLQSWRAEGKKETAESYGLEGNVDYRLEKYPEAIAAIKKAQSMTDKPQDSWNQILLAAYADSGKTDEAGQVAQDALKKNPNDAGALRNAVSLLVQQQKYDEALKLMEQGRAQGVYKDEKDYINMVKVYLVAAQQGNDNKGDATKAGQVLDEGLSKGIIKPGYESYKLAGDAAYIAEDHAKALENYRKAVPFATDGELSVTVGSLLLEDNKPGDAKKALQDGLSKGVQHKGKAYVLLAEAERQLKDKPGAIAAMKQAAQDPETSAKANAWLKTADKQQ
jgi:predicted negative regulator of RcsB-dependent stress response